MAPHHRIENSSLARTVSDMGGADVQVYVFCPAPRPYTWRRFRLESEGHSGVRNDIEHGGARGGRERGRPKPCRRSSNTGNVIVPNVPPAMT